MARGAVVVSYHNVTGRVLQGMMGRAAAPIRALMLRLERRVARLADAIICVSGRDRGELQALVAAAPFGGARIIPLPASIAPVQGMASGHGLDAYRAAPTRLASRMLPGRFNTNS